MAVTMAMVNFMTIQVGMNEWLMWDNVDLQTVVSCVGEDIEEDGQWRVRFIFIVRVYKYLWLNRAQ